MELCQSTINGVKVAFCVNISNNTYVSKPIPKNGYYLMAFDSGTGSITMEQFNQRLFHIKDNVFDEVMNAIKKDKNPIDAISQIEEVQSWVKTIGSNLIKGNGDGEVMIKLNNRPNKI